MSLTVSLDEKRKHRASEDPIVGGLPEVPGIIVAMSLSPGLATHLRGLANELLVKDYPGASLTRAERELIATAVSGANECFYCMDSHGAFALALLPEANGSSSKGDAHGASAKASATGAAANALIEGLKAGDSSGLSNKMRALIDIARIVQRRARDLTRDDVTKALRAGATDADTQLTVLIASAFCMYNRMVDGLRARTPPSADAYRERATQIAAHGYVDPRVASIPR
jgi:alkylhydroperoxidase family enzyme